MENLPRGSLTTPHRVLRRGQEPIALAPWPENFLANSTATTLLTADSIATTPLEKRALAQATGADLVDMETWGVARRAMAAGLDCHSLRVISDAVDDQLPPEVARLVQPQSSLRRLGAACAALGRRPGAAVDLWRLWEHAVVDGKSLAFALEQLCGSLPVSPPA
jgi:adenosylhomocysteine nucleosidase